MDRPRRLDLRHLLTRAEAAAPVGAVDAMAAALREMLGARDVSLLIADFSGRTLNRLGHAATNGPGSRREETAEREPLDGTPYGAAIADQRTVLLRKGDDTRVLAPVTSRGEAVGVLELVLPFEPDPDARGPGASGPSAGLRGDRQPALHRPVRVGPAHGAALARRGDPAAPAPGHVHLRSGPVHARRLARARRRGRGRHVRLLAGPPRAAPVDDRRDGPLRALRPAGHARGGRAPQPAPARRLADRSGAERPRGAARVRAGRRLRHGPARPRRPRRAHGDSW